MKLGDDKDWLQGTGHKFRYYKEAVPVRVRGGPSKHIPISNFAVESMARERT